MTPDLIAAYVVIVGIPLWLVVEAIMSGVERRELARVKIERDRPADIRAASRLDRQTV